MSGFQRGVAYAAEVAKLAADRVEKHRFGRERAAVLRAFADAIVAPPEQSSGDNPPPDAPLLPVASSPPPSGPSAEVAVAAVAVLAVGHIEARQMGYTGDSCPDCGNFKMVRNGACLKCEACGATTGCS